MKPRDHFRKKAPSTDLLVCFPSRAHLALMPKPICSPARASEPNKHHHSHTRHRRNKSITGVPTSSPLLWAKNKQITGGGGPEISEPTSPKVTCAGQIKVRHKGAAACKSWQSVMEEIERIHKSRQTKKRSPASWIGSIGIKKEVMQFLTCLRNIKFDFRCFGAIPQSEITSDDDEIDDELEEEEEFRGAETSHGGGAEGGGGAVFSKWFMVLENDEKEKSFSDVNQEGSAPPAAAPPANALLLMRCRSAPAKSWQEEKEEEDLEKERSFKNEEKKGGKNLKALMEEENRNNKNELEESILKMKYDTDYYKISSDIATETWVNVNVNVGGDIKDPFSRSRSWKR